MDKYLSNVPYHLLQIDALETS